MKKLDLQNFDIISVNEIIGLYENNAHRDACKNSKVKTFKRFSILLTVMPKKRFEILTPESFNNGKEINYDNIDELLHYKIENEGVCGIKKGKKQTELEKQQSELEKQITIIKQGIRNIDFIETIIDGKIRYIARDAEAKHIEIEWKFNDYYTWKEANNIIKHDLVEKSDNPIYFEHTQKFVNSLISRHALDGKEFVWDYSKDINIIDEQ